MLLVILSFWRINPRHDPTLATSGVTKKKRQASAILQPSHWDKNRHVPLHDAAGSKKWEVKKTTAAFFSSHMMSRRISTMTSQTSNVVLELKVKLPVHCTKGPKNKFQPNPSFFMTPPPHSISSVISSTGKRDMKLGYEKRDSTLVRQDT